MQQLQPVGHELFKQLPYKQSVKVHQYSFLTHFFFFFFIRFFFIFFIFVNINKSLLSAINSNTNTNNVNRYNELRVTQSYNTVLAVLGENAACQPDRNLAGIPLYCDQTTTRFTVSATSSSSTVFAIAVNGGAQVDFNDFLLFILLFLSFFIQQYFRLCARTISLHM